MDVRQGGGTACRIPAILSLTGRWRFGDLSVPPGCDAAVHPKLLVAWLAVFAWGSTVGQGECNANPTSISEGGKGELEGGLSAAAVSAVGGRGSVYNWRQLQWCFLAGQVWRPLPLSHPCRCLSQPPFRRPIAMKPFQARAAAAITAALVLAACDGNPSSITAPETPSFDGGGLTFGGGNRSDTTTTTTASQGGDAVVSGGGLTFGGGN